MYVPVLNKPWSVTLATVIPEIVLLAIYLMIVLHFKSYLKLSQLEQRLMVGRD